MADNMRAARIHKLGGPLRIDVIPVPAVGPDDVLVKIAACGTQDGDYKLIHGELPLNRLPLTIGHEPAGTVARVGSNVRGWQEGTRVFVDPSIGCGNCRFCNAGKEMYCGSYGVMGMTHFTPAGKALFEMYGDGGFAEYMKVPATNLRRLPEAISFTQAAKIAFLGVAFKAVERTRLKAGETIVISGASGALGTCAVMAAKALGAARIIAVARDKGRLERVCRVNPEVVIPVSTRDDPELHSLQELTGGIGADVYVDCLATGIDVTKGCLMSLRKGARAALIGGVVGTLDLEYPFFMHREIEVTGSVGLGRANFYRVVQMMCSKVVDFSNFVTHEFLLEQANEAIATIIEKKDNPLGVIVRPYPEG